MTFNTPDLIDADEQSVQSCALQFRQFGGRPQFCGPIRTLKIREDNALVRQALTSPGQGHVLVVDGGGSLRTALIGDKLGQLAQQNGWAGLILCGAVRDVSGLRQLDLGIKALGTNPRRSAKAGAGAVDVPVSFGGATFVPGHWVYSDDDGIVTAPHPLHLGG
jgi:regulator of ribonuclease activity A